MLRIPIWPSLDPRPAWRRVREGQSEAMASMRTKRLVAAYAERRRCVDGKSARDRPGD